MDGTGGLEVVVLCKLFDQFQQYVKIARKSDEKVLYTITLSLGNLSTIHYNSFIKQFNDLKNKG